MTQSETTLISYSLSAKGRLLNFSKQKHSWKLLFNGRPVQVDACESLFSKAFRVFIDEKKAFEGYPSNAQLVAGIEVIAADFKICVRKETVGRFALSVNDKLFAAVFDSQKVKPETGYRAFEDEKESEAALVEANAESEKPANAIAHSAVCVRQSKPRPSPAATSTKKTNSQSEAFFSTPLVGRESFSGICARTNGGSQQSTTEKLGADFDDRLNAKSKKGIAEPSLKAKCNIAEWEFGASTPTRSVPNRSANDFGECKDAENGKVWENIWENRNYQNESNGAEITQKNAFDIRIDDFDFGNLIPKIGGISKENLLI